MKTLIGFTAVGVIAAVLSGGGSKVVDSACKISLAQFSNMKIGMSVYQIERDIGCAGKELSRNEFSGITTVMLGWDGAGSLGANINATFQNNKLVSKAQFGLR